METFMQPFWDKILNFTLDFHSNSSTLAPNLSAYRVFIKSSQSY